MPVEFWQLPSCQVLISASNDAGTHCVKTCCGGPAAFVCYLSPWRSEKLIVVVWVQAWTLERMGMCPWPMGTRVTTLTLVRPPAAA